MGKYSIRVNTEEEYKRFENIFFTEGIGDALVSDMEFAEDNAKNLRNKNLICYLLTDGENDIGIAAAYIFPIIKKAILDVGALKEYRGKLIKNAAKEALEDFCKEHKDFDIFAKVLKKNKKSLYFCFSVGLKIATKLNNKYILRLNNGIIN